MRVAIAVVVPVLLLGAVSSPAPTVTGQHLVAAGSVAGSVRPSSGTSASASLPRHVSRARLVQVLRTASRATEKGLRDGATWRRGRRISWTLPLPDTRFADRGRTRGGAALFSVSGGGRLLVRRESGELFTPLPIWLAGREVPQRAADDALVRLERPGASWVRSRSWEARLLEDVSRSLLVTLPRQVERWSWRSRGGTTDWVLVGTRPRPFRVTITLDARSRVVRLTERREGGPHLPLPVRGDRTVWSFRYGASTAAIELPSPDQWVSQRSLMRELGLTTGPVPT